jgi:hypothetical protein
LPGGHLASDGERAHPRSEHLLGVAGIDVHGSRRIAGTRHDLVPVGARADDRTGDLGGWLRVRSDLEADGYLGCVQIAASRAQLRLAALERGLQRRDAALHRFEVPERQADADLEFTSLGARPAELLLDLTEGLGLRTGGEHDEQPDHRTEQHHGGGNAQPAPFRSAEG